MRNIDLDITPSNGLRLSDPFWVASSHFSVPAMFKVWAKINPAALTLKTATRIDRNEPWKTTSIKEKTSEMLDRFGRSFYSDEPKSTNFYAYEDAKEQIQEAKRTLPETKIGASVLATKNEDFREFRKLTKAADFGELNLKYSMRSQPAGESYVASVQGKWEETFRWTQGFLNSFPDVPVFVKLPRELNWIPGTKECSDLLELLKTHGKAGLVVANSLKFDVADFVHGGTELHLRNGVLTGDVFYDGTIKLIQSLKDEKYPTMRSNSAFGVQMFSKVAKPNKYMEGEKSTAHECGK
ncbi:MAG: hypothetical protein ACLP3K_16205 [Candidatus Acidiferrales bacterium]